MAYQVAGFNPDEDIRHTYTQHGYLHIYIRLNTALSPENASEERKPSNNAMSGILGGNGHESTQ